MNLICRRCDGREFRRKPRSRKEWICQSCRRHYIVGTGQRHETKLAARLPWPERVEEITSGLTSCLDPRKWMYFTHGVLERVYMRRGLLI